jgi:prolyl-tRNA editing enzyme YbaK/EbsC (Cys-tRNA(Pro) deacylase)
MSISPKVAAYLKRARVAFAVVAHRTVFTAFDLANTLREKLERIGKTLLVKADTRYVLVVLPANRRLDLAKLKTAIGTKKISIATEKDMVRELRVKPGAITPFGALHALEVFADATLLKTKDILLGAGSFTESIRMKVKDYVALERVRIARFSESAGLPAPVQSGRKPKRKVKKPAKRKKSKRKTTKR